MHRCIERFKDGLETLDHKYHGNRRNNHARKSERGPSCTVEISYCLNYTVDRSSRGSVYDLGRDGCSNRRIVSPVGHIHSDFIGPTMVNICPDLKNPI